MRPRANAGVGPAPAVMSSPAVRRGSIAIGCAVAAWSWRHVRSPAVRGWTPPRAGRRVRAGPLQVRDSGGSADPLVCLHGLTASGEVFGGGFDPLARHHRLVVPDLLGFGRSMQPGRDDFSLRSHLDALDEMATALGLDGRPLTVTGHSMGAVLALHWAAHRPETRAVAALCAPLFESRSEADRQIGGMGAFERLLALEGPLSRAVCAWMCEHRRAASFLAPVLQPQWPIPIARQGVLHTWDAYLRGMNLIRNPGWSEALAALDRSAVPVSLLEAAADPVPVPGRATALAARYAQVTTVEHPLAGHDLPYRDPAWCVARIVG